MATFYVISILFVIIACSSDVRQFVLKLADSAETLCPPNLMTLILPLSVLVVLGWARVAAIATVVPHRFGLNNGLYADFVPRDFFLTKTSLSPISSINLMMTMFALIGALALSALYFRLRVSLGRREYIACALAALAIYVPSYFSTTVASADIYAYVAYARMGLAAYSAPLQSIAIGEFAPLSAAVHHAWGSLDPAPYGPAWLALSSFIFGHTGTIAQAILANRALDITALMIIGYTLWQLKVPRATILVFLINPFTAFYFVGDGHNDIVAVALAFVGMYLSKKNLAISTIVFILAGLIKAPYMIASLTLLSGFTQVRERIAAAFAIVIGTIACSSYFGGRAYLDALREHARNNSSQTLIALEHCALLAIIGYILIRALFQGRSVANTSIALTSLTAAVYPWYIGLALPYAAATDGLTVLTLISPLLYAVMDPVYNAGILRYVLVISLTVAIGMTYYKKKFAPQSELK